MQDCCGLIRCGASILVESCKGVTAREDNRLLRRTGKPFNKRTDATTDLCDVQSRSRIPRLTMTKIFLSCGQNSAKEIRAAAAIAAMLRKRGFKCYVAKKVTTILAINTDIIRELKNSDCFLFVNFRRERLPSRHRGEHLGSLFSAQELGIAYSLGFQRILIVNQTRIRREGLLAYMACNTDEFASFRDCVRVVKKAVDQAGWKADYSRRLRAGGLRLSNLPHYGNSHVRLTGQMFYLEIHNDRPDIAAIGATGRLVSHRQVGSKIEIPSNVQSPLKAAGRPSYSHTIFPKSHEEFDLLLVGKSPTSAAPDQDHLYLNSALDLVPTPWLPMSYGEYVLKYEFYAIDFPLLSVKVRLSWPESGPPSASILSQECV
jgi:hypothetical protein